MNFLQLEVLGLSEAACPRPLEGEDSIMRKGVGKQALNMAGLASHMLVRLAASERGRECHMGVLGNFLTNIFTVANRPKEEITTDWLSRCCCPAGKP